MVLKRLGAWVSAALVVALLAGMPGGIALAQGAQTPEQICDEAAQDIVEPETREFEQAEDVLEVGTLLGSAVHSAGPDTVNLFEEICAAGRHQFCVPGARGYFNNDLPSRAVGLHGAGRRPDRHRHGRAWHQFEDETDNDQSSTGRCWRWRTRVRTPTGVAHHVQR